MRKVILLGLHVFLENNLRVYKALLGVLVLTMFSVVMGRLNPYKVMLVNRLQYREMVATTLTLYSGVIYLQDNNSAQGSLIAFKLVFFVVVIIVNARFIMLWIYALA